MSNTRLYWSFLNGAFFKPERFIKQICLLAPELANANRQIIVYVTFLHSMGEDPDELDDTTTREKEALQNESVYAIFGDFSTDPHGRTPVALQTGHHSLTLQ